mmetsp:Transcript_12417/g.18611  ORF Transcript_12417/g.18611 Transcript_12417/m.18611 type:complete len:456 (+) Transcript_12417:3-1370(+)
MLKQFSALGCRSRITKSFSFIHRDVRTRARIPQVFKNKATVSNELKDLEPNIPDLLDSPPTISIPLDHEREYTQHKFIDKVQIEVQAGRGGNGCISYEVLSPGKKRPSGGNGGRGGHVFIISENSHSMIGLNFSTLHFNAQNGTHGGSAGLTGKNGVDLYITVPVGTVVTEREKLDIFPDEDTFEEEDENNELDVEDNTDNDGYNFDNMDSNDDNSSAVSLDEPGQVLLVAEGGRGGIGNQNMAGTATRRQKSLPVTKLPGNTGESRSIILELKTMADVGLVGYPNAGKSSLLRALSNATPRVGPYPFTTLNPSVGIVEYSDLERISVADIPGLVDGAHENRGLGHDFLKHIEKTKALLFVVDVSGWEERQPAEDLRHLLYELEMYDPKLLQRPAMVFANKIDLPVMNKQFLKRLVAETNKYNYRLVTGSTHTGAGLAELAAALRHLVRGTTPKS